MEKKVNLTEKFDLIHQYWTPHIAGRLNGQEVKLAKLKGEFVWHSHDLEDEMFLVIKGELQIEFRDRTETIGEGEFIIVPRGVEHKPVAGEEVQVLLFEPAGTVNTGNADSELTVKELKDI